MALVSTGISNCLRIYDVKATRDHQSVFVDTSHLSLNVIHWNTLLSSQELKFDFMRLQQGIACIVQWYIPLCWVTCGDWLSSDKWATLRFQHSNICGLPGRHVKQFGQVAVSKLLSRVCSFSDTFACCSMTPVQMHPAHVASLVLLSPGLFSRPELMVEKRKQGL